MIDHENNRVVARTGTAVTLLFGAKDTKHNNARALEAFVGEV